jgi:hypothetical protein
LIPPFNQDGYLPPGVHRASIDEILSRFGGDSEIRRAACQSLQWLLPICRAAGIVRLIVNGSFTTDCLEPNDADCVLLQGPAYNELSVAAAELEQGLPFLSLQIVRQTAFDYLVNSYFASDRSGLVKGVVEIIL